jgi:arylsulfatase A-like enzyme
MPRCDLVDRRRAVISGDYKLIAFGDDRSYQLYNVTRDFREEEELSAKEPEKLEAMKALYQKVSAEIPVVRVVGSAPLKGAPPGRGW